MALITYVDDRYKARVWKMPSYVTTITDLDEYLESRTTPGIVIVHGGQRDAQLKLLPAGPTKLVAAAQKACSGGRAIIFSGGFPMVSTDVLRQQLADSGLREGEHYLLLTAVLNLLDEVDFPLLQRTVLTPRWLVSEASFVTPCLRFSLSDISVRPVCSPAIRWTLITTLPSSLAESRSWNESVRFVRAKRVSECWPSESGATRWASTTPLRSRMRSISNGRRASSANAVSMTC